MREWLHLERDIKKIIVNAAVAIFRGQKIADKLLGVAYLEGRLKSRSYGSTL